MNNLKIKTKLILLFIIIKVIPLILISYIAIKGAGELNIYFEQTTKDTFGKSKDIIGETANKAISDSIKALDKKSQSTLERLTYETAKDVANFLYERDKDLLFLSSLELNEKVLKSFYESKNSPVFVTNEYEYNQEKKTWQAKVEKTVQKGLSKANLKENSKEFNINTKLDIHSKILPLYKEIQVIDLDGNEILKFSSIKKKKINIKNKKETYCKAENYFTKLQKLKKGEIYVSNVIGAYVKTDLIGTYTEEKASKMGKKFDPKNSAYAGKENPVGKRFEGIIRFATPLYKKGKKVGYVGFALDHRHIMEFTDNLDPLVENTSKVITDASSGNYAFMWDNVGRNISHPRDYFIVGYNNETGKQVPGWVSLEIAQKFEKSGKKDLGNFLEEYPVFHEQSLQKKPNIAQLKTNGEVGLDCRYLNFAPQCNGWMQLTEDGGYGSFVIHWSGVDKLTTAASIPYFTGDYGKSKRGFGFVTIGANVEEFHQAANKTKESVQAILDKQVEYMKDELDSNKFNVIEYIKSLVNELLTITFVMVLIIIAIAIWMSNLVTNKISSLLRGTKEYSKHNFDYKIEITSKDEIGELEQSFNMMASDIQELISKQKNTNTLLDLKVKEANAASKAKSDFLASMSHEIRTPLNAILGFIGILNEQESNKQKKEYLKIVENSGNNLLQIINDILDFSKIESNKIELEYLPVKPYETFVHTAKQFIISAEKKNITFTINISKELEKEFSIDLIKFVQVMNNLLSNAVKFTPENGSVVLEIDYDKSKHELYLSVEDTGIGIAKEKQDIVFEPFSQEDTSTTRKYGGTGLGLTISSKLIHLMGGELKLDKNREVGARFYFTIALHPTVHQEIEVQDTNKSNEISEKQTEKDNSNEKLEIADLSKEKNQISQIEKKKILIAEDNKSNQMFMTILMKKLSLDFKIAVNGREAVECYKESDYDLILMDENMPILSGSAATQEIRQLEAGTDKHIPIIALTANALVGDKEKFLEVGMDDYLSKPLQKNDLEQMIIKYTNVT